MRSLERAVFVRDKCDTKTLRTARVARAVLYIMTMAVTLLTAMTLVL